ncbi:MAG: LPS export ABC transporter periplasmic protein LptC [Ignavibacteria bacterium]|nr:LPS export ABC transporter periplasmic protein LptC [Ignavibacteria bacterium]
MKVKLIVASMFCICITSCSKQAHVAKSADDPFLTAPSHMSYNVKVKFADSSRTKATLQSGVAYLSEESRETSFGKSVVVDFFSVESGKRLARMTADSAVVDDRTSNMTAIGNVVVFSDSTRTTLTTQKLLWENHSQLLKSTEFVRIVSPSEKIEGMGFVSDRFLKSYRIFKVSGIQQQ